MYIFFLDLFMDIDSFSPIIYKLNRKFPGRVIICSTNFIQDNENIKLIKNLKNSGVKYYKLHSNNLTYNLVKLLLKIISMLPRKFLNRLRFIYSYVYKNIFCFEDKDLLELFSQNNTKVVTLDESNPIKKIKKIKSVCDKLNIKLILAPSGVEILDINLFRNEADFKYCNYFFANNLDKYKVSEDKIKNKVIKLGSPRYCDEWLKTLDTMFPVKPIEDNKKTKVGILLTQKTQNFPINCEEIKKLLEDKNLIIKFRNKPRDYMPDKCCDFFYDEFSTTELINWSDVIISVQSSPIIEALKKNKHILYLDYCVSKSFGSWIKKYKCVDLIESKDDLFNKINQIKQKKYFFERENCEEYIETVVGVENKNEGILDKYVNFYKKIV